MTTKDDYVSKRQLRAIKKRGKKHSYTISGNVLGLFPQPLDLASSEQKRQSTGDEKDVHTDIENITLSIDLDVKDMAHDDSFIQLLGSLVGLKKVEKDFEVISTAEKVIRAFGRAKFKNVVSIEIDGKNIYNNPEDYFDVKDALTQLITEVFEKKTGGDEIFMILLSKEHDDCIVEVDINRVHFPWMHDILIKFNGILPEEYFRRVINYLDDHLEIEDIEKEWKKMGASK